MKVRLPDWLNEELNKRGVVDVRANDLRRAPRFRCCGVGILTPAPSPLTDKFQQEQAQVILEDLSRHGIGMISHQQWFPDQPISVMMVAAELHARVVRIRYVGPECYNIGAIITKLRNYEPEEARNI